MSEIQTVTDAKGRKLSIRPLTVLDQVKILRAIGADQSRNEPYVQIVTVAMAVSDIDGHPIPMPQNQNQIDAMISRLGDEGFAAIQLDLTRRVAEIEAAAEAAADGTPPDPLEPSA